MKTSVKWIFTDKHGDEVLALLWDLDKSERNKCEAVVLKRREEWKAEMAAKWDAEKWLKDLERDEKKKVKEAEHVAQEEECAKAADHANAKAQAAAVTKCPKKWTWHKPLQGTFILNLTPATPMPVPHVCCFSLSVIVE